MNDIIKIIYNELKAIGTNIPILIVLILGNVGYGFLYNLLYNTNVYRDAPIAVVDMSQSDVSRHFIGYIDVAQQVEVIMKTQDFHEAKRKLLEREIVGFLYIPSDLKENIMRGKQTECLPEAAAPAPLRRGYRGRRLRLPHGRHRQGHGGAER